MYEEYKPFTIDLEDVAYWLETRKSDLHLCTFKTPIFNL